VKVELQNVKLRTKWLRKPFSASVLQNWLVNDTSLTARLQKRYRDFYVKPLFQRNAKPINDEARMLALRPSTNAYIREVLLIGNQQPVVYAHSVLPHRSLRGTWYRLGRLGNQPLGAALFKNMQVTRTPLSYKKLSNNHVLYRKAVREIAHPPPYLWARRSVFRLKCANIMVTEVFLPELCHE
jgi:chorismate--pyruvate lyase